LPGKKATPICQCKNDPVTTPQTVNIRANTPAGTWTIQLPLVESEQFDTTTNDLEGGKAMRATQISITRRGRDTPPLLMFLGSDPSRSRTLGRKTDVEEFSSRCPETMYHVVNAADELVERIRSEADRAVEEIRSALTT
jgi:hypothetical protein